MNDLTLAKLYNKKKVLALSGGVGGAKLVLGLSKVLHANQLTVLCNTADDFEHWGLSISPDLDTVMYTLAGLSNQQQGWGLVGESWRVINQVTALGGDDWFKLGDQDLATHLCRTQWLAQGQTLGEVTTKLCKKLNVDVSLLPMSNDRVQTRVQSPSGELSFQNYFVKQQCQPVVQGFSFAGIEQAKPNQKLMSLLNDEQLAAIIICPSNPFVSIDPMLSLTGVREAIKASKAPVIAISPIVGGTAIKGPAAKMMQELGIDCSSQSIVKHYNGLLNGIIIDELDSHLAQAITNQGLAVRVTNTVMNSIEDKQQLAYSALDFSAQLVSKAVC